MMFRENKKCLIDKSGHKAFVLWFTGLSGFGSKEKISDIKLKVKKIINVVEQIAQ